MAGVIDDYLLVLRHELRRTGRDRRRMLRETEAHLHESVRQELDAGRSSGDAETAAIQRFGPVSEIGRCMRTELLDRRVSRHATQASSRSPSASSSPAPSRPSPWSTWPGTRPPSPSSPRRVPPHRRTDRRCDPHLRGSPTRHDTNGSPNERPRAHDVGGLRSAGRDDRGSACGGKRPAASRRSETRAAAGGRRPGLHDRRDHAAAQCVRGEPRERPRARTNAAPPVPHRDLGRIGRLVGPIVRGHRDRARGGVHRRRRILGCRSAPARPRWSPACRPFATASALPHSAFA